MKLPLGVHGRVELGDKMIGMKIKTGKPGRPRRLISKDDYLKFLVTGEMDEKTVCELMKILRDSK